MEPEVVAVVTSLCAFVAFGFYVERGNRIRQAKQARDARVAPDMDLPLSRRPAWKTKANASNDQVINPATGLPMVDGIGGFDTAGNPYGAQRSHDSAGHDGHDFGSHGHDFGSHGGGHWNDGRGFGGGGFE